MLLIVDIDGTVADPSHRAHHVEPEDGSKPTQEMWDTFLSPELVAKDTPIPRAKYVLTKIVEKFENTQIVWLTGRSHLLRATTYQWLHDHFEELIPNSMLIVREEGEYFRCHATKYKGAMIKKLMENPLYAVQPKLAFDDDLYMFPVYDQLGVAALRAPDCWDVLCPGGLAVTPGTEDVWRK